MKMQNSGEPRGSLRIMIRYMKDFTPFCDENCKNRTQAMVNEDIVCTFYIPSKCAKVEMHLWLFD